MAFILTSVALLLACGLLALFFSTKPRVSSLLGAAGPVIACGPGLVPVLQLLSGGEIASLRAPWSMPLGSFAVGMDGLSAFFLLPIFVIGALTAIYGAGYMMSQEVRGAHGASWFLFNVLIASMVTAVAARDGLLFLAAWEIMALSSFFLVAFEKDKGEVRRASWIYLVAAHIGTAFLLVMFLLLGREGGGLDFDRLGGLSPETAALCFVFAVIGFGTKAGIMPFHVWLPEAHPAAPSHVSALMSGVMIKTGIYGILRIIGFLGPVQLWWGWVLIGIGLVTGILGVLFALAQHDLKRLLAYSSVENIGIIVTGIGVGLLGLGAGSPLLAVSGFTGALMHVLNHALFKSLLFMGAGSVLHATHTREIDRLGGLLRRMPWTAGAFLVGAVAISGLPPLNGFVSEFLVYVGSFKGLSQVQGGSAGALLAVIAGLALIGGLTAATFTKAFGMVFLGTPRTDEHRDVRESGAGMLIPLGVLACACLVAGIFGFQIVQVMTPVVGSLLTSAGSGIDTAIIRSEVSQVSGYLKSATWGALGILALAGLIAWLRLGLLSGRSVREAGTWDCGYAQPNARMQYTASSFAQPIMEFFTLIHRWEKRLKPPQGYFPTGAYFATETLDTSQEKVYRPVFEGVGRLLSKLQVIQQGRIQLYVLYIVVTLLILLVWKLG
jgi:hydrogenase-4 component B